MLECFISVDRTFICFKNRRVSRKHYISYHLSSFVYFVLWLFNYNFLFFRQQIVFYQLLFSAEKIKAFTHPALYFAVGKYLSALLLKLNVLKGTFWWKSKNFGCFWENRHWWRKSLGLTLSANTSSWTFIRWRISTFLWYPNLLKLNRKIISWLVSSNFFSRHVSCLISLIFGVNYEILILFDSSRLYFVQKFPSYVRCGDSKSWVSHSLNHRFTGRRGGRRIFHNFSHIALRVT